MVECVINVNKRGINSIEAPKSVETIVGEDIILKIFNNGSPLHLTVSVINGRVFTHFLHENIFMEESVSLKIPVLSNSPPGKFQVEVITGYGAVKKSFDVIVKEREIEIPEIVEDIPVSIDKKVFVYPAALIILIVLGWIAYIVSYLYLDKVTGFASVIILTITVLIAWRYRP
ncbi:hypothetical protein F1737_11060 [Methanoplanus sp. FWC-SCC4]|uniref:Uncharacterized protein n=1 Tax=Methanochimaera problematica TaxID=2609417 RepID=A0AA97FFE2_9EURY|nr:hypothetical protein [Methanoplanus sp. FWC-SCC4]WOF17179.1 hypothetical protein F1737_11060 [Methanoplanus sp. FWC-SCC4]